MSKTAIVGSRYAPTWALELMIRAGRTCVDLGIGISSGDAYGSDRAGWYGAIQSDKWDTVESRIYIIRNGFLGRRIENLAWFHDASMYTDTIPTAMAMACAARGSFNGLGRTGIELHTRNVFQIHGHTLREPVSTIIAYGEQKTPTSVISGGTNTAWQLALDANVPTMYNLYWSDDVKRLEEWLSKNESDEPYMPIDWSEILDPKDSRLPELMDEYNN
ncbi:DNA-protecting protein DprA [Pseudomonas aeruginosa]|uniref:DNA-protecting protein DprA n=1 Tax=Pseudomonas aeruginosa TaxID=287 RepID=UPI001CA58A27|nr:DNA-protecting protein DprA [Pseudomonas aeruginosa]MBW6070119.1 DNA-protecting protein DprA [Pseudomonas aeruginosa]